MPFRRLPIPTLIAALLVCGGAHAQSAPPADSTSLDRVTVTGSNLRRADTETPSPVQTLTLDQIKQSGYTDLSDVLHDLSSNGAGTLSQSFGGAFAAGASGIALRGLTVSATLVLIDGHRVAPNAQPDDGQRLFTDVSSIPLEAIDRVEVLKDGASSIYGSDAIAGVINIILKKNFVGNEVSAEYGISKYADGRMRHVTGTFGFGDLDADGHNTYVALEYREQDPIFVRDRPQLARTDYTSQGGNNTTLGVPNSLNGGIANSLTGYFTDPTSGAITQFLPGCNNAAYQAGKCTYTFEQNYLQIPTQNLNALASFTQKLPGDFELSVKASLFDTHSSTTQGFASTGGTGGVLSSVVGPNTPLGIYPASGNPIVATVPANYPGNHTGTPQVLNINFGNETPNISEDSQNYRFSADVTGTAWGFDTTLSVGYSEDLIYKKFTGLVDYGALSAALNNPVTPYRVGQAFGLNSAAQNAAVFPTDTSLATSKLAFINAEASRDIYQLPGGPLTVGVGVDYRHLELDSEAPTLIAEGKQINNNAYAIGNQNVSAVYGELSAPIVKQLEVDASVRYDSYSGSFSSTTPKVGIKFTPIEQVTFRGTYSEGFRAPNPAEEGQVGQGFLIGVIPDPILCGNPGANPSKTPGNYPVACNTQAPLVQQAGENLKPEKSKSYTAGLILEPVKNYSLSLDYYNIKVTNQIISAISDPDFDLFGNVVRGTPTLQPYVNAAGQTVSAVPPVGTIAYIPLPYLNAAYTRTNGVDLDARGKLDLGNFGRITADLTETHVFEYQQKYGSNNVVELAGTHGPSGVSGDTGNPRDRAQFVVAYDRGPLAVTGTTNWTSGYSVLDPTQNQLDCASAIGSSPALFFRGANPPPQYCRVKAFTTFDLFASYKLTKALMVHASIINLFNENAPQDFATYGAAGNSSGVPYNPAFAQAGAIGRFFTVGAQYRF